MFTYEHPKGDYWTLAGGDFRSLLSRININGGIILNPVNAGIYISATKYTFRRIAIINVILETGSALYCFQTAKSGTGAISGCYASAYVSPINASSVLGGSSDGLVDLSGNFATAPNDCADGSTFRGNGIFRLRKDNNNQTLTRIAVFILAKLGRWNKVGTSIFKVIFPNLILGYNSNK
ncbi:hypothetical protein [Peribacillus frigoritolerans]|uniref:hypothetical protein n=1 Tax=Peribacillus frigoritolerans TaxID=450367 RepID=UPI0022324A22|nr:hypothetical protein [Peribacillus frigoritolerans]UZD49128.1 hypothetical protein OMJ04_12015 [Peribacillus frigoritolerans]